MPNPIRRIAIAGGGIAGLAAAIAFADSNFEVHLFEADDGPRLAGGAHGIARNGLRVLEALGLGDEMRRQSEPLHRAIITDHRLKRLSQFPDDAFGVAIPRKALLAILTEAARKTPPTYGKRLAGVEQGAGGVGLRFADGTSFEADILLGCDGIYSAARAAVAPETQVRFVNEAYWAGISDFDVRARYDWQFCEIWGPKRRFGIVGLSPKKDAARCYWFACLPSEKRDVHAPIDKREIEDAFRGFAEPVGAVLAATPRETIFLANSLDLMPTDGPWYRGAVCLMGDAAHATTPNLAQGANQALEDALALSKCLRKNPTTEAFAEFRRLRVNKVQGVVKDSWLFGKISLWEPPWTILRNFVLRTTPPGVMKKRMEKLSDISYLTKL